MENWKDINEEEDQASKAWLVLLFLMSWETSMPNVMLKFLNIFVIKGTNFYFGHKDKVYVINKELIVDVFEVYAKKYVKDMKGHVNKSLALQTLQSYKIAPTNSTKDQWNAKSLGLPYSVRYPTITSMIY